MKTIAIIATGLLLPAALFADVEINVRLSNDNIQYETPHQSCNHYDANEYVSVEEPWFEEHECNGPIRVSFEYQWTIRGGVRVLVSRKVNFHTINNNWVFGPWILKSNFCHASCHANHKHVYYHKPVYSQNWKRCNSRNNDGRVSYYYEYRQPVKSRTAQPKVYRYEYRPATPRHYESNHSNNSYNGNKKYETNRPNSNVKKVQVVPQNNNKSQTINHDDRNRNTDKKVVRVSGREQVR
jgi:hypothetical protein